LDQIDPTERSKLLRSEEKQNEGLRPWGRRFRLLDSQSCRRHLLQLPLVIFYNLNPRSSNDAV
ncbi:hypothetical protein LINPERHAP2_LOCUS5445, partial [Linum perenne]